MCDTDSDTESDIVKLQSALLPSTQSGSVETSNLEKSESILACEKAIELNEKCDDMLKLLQYRLGVCLSNCTRKLTKLKDLMENPVTEIKLSKLEGSYYKLGAPYFKDKNDYGCPPNSDVKKLEKLGIEVYATQKGVKWTNTQKNYLQCQVHNEAKSKKRYQLQLKMKKISLEIESLRNKSNAEDSATVIELQKELDLCGEELRQVNSLPIESLVQPLKEKEEFDWVTIHTNSGKRLMHTPGECRAMWNLYLHPEISKTGWTYQEQFHLKELAQQHRLQDWDTIASLLNTQRTPYQCFLFYRLRLNTKIPWEWTPEEDNYLRSLVESCRIGDLIPWSKVAYYMENRSKVQCYNRWVYALSHNKYGRFLPEEDAFIMAAVKKFGENFLVINKYMEHRKPSVLKRRHEILVSCKEKGYDAFWNSRSDHKLWALVSQHTHPDVEDIDFSTITQHFPGKTPYSIKRRYKLLKSWLQKSTRNTILNIPRKTVRVTHSKGDNFYEALNKLQERYARFPQDKKRRGKPNDTKRKANVNRCLHQQILNYFDKDRERCVEVAPSKYPTTQQDLVCLRNVLILLGAKLDKNLIDNSKNELLKGVAKGLMAMEDKNLSVVTTPSQIKVMKTYSRKAKAPSAPPTTPESRMQPSVFSGEGAETHLYSPFVLPPTLSSMLAFKNILSKDFLKTGPQYMQPQVENLTKRWNHRFKVLFTWPTNLSNIPSCIKDDIFEENSAVGLNNSYSSQAVSEFNLDFNLTNRKKLPGKPSSSDGASTSSSAKKRRKQLIKVVPIKLLKDDKTSE